MVAAEASKKIAEFTFQRLVQDDSGASARKPPTGFHIRQRDRDCAVEAAFVDSVRQKPRRIPTVLVVVDRPVEMHVAVDQLEFAWVMVRTNIPDIGAVG